jgi:hypothetical protein
MFEHEDDEKLKNFESGEDTAQENQTGDESPETETERELGGEERVMGNSGEPKRPNWFKRCLLGYWHRKKWTLPLTAILFIGVIFALPFTRYPLLALGGMKRPFAVVVIDSKTNTPVSGAEVMLDGKTVTTNSVGGATFQAKVGKRTIEVSKQYYKSFSESVFVGIHTSTNARFVHLDATGRQVPIKVVNKITGKAVANAEVKVLDTEAKTDSNGMATIVLPTASATQSATISASGYNSLTTNIEVTGKIVPANTFQVTPAGRVYFLSNLSGKIDVVSANLDSTGRKTVLAGTGSEDQSNTVLLASRDWKYLALLSKRDGGNYPKLFLINTKDDSVTTMDEGTVSYTLIGWSGHRFVYQSSNQNVPDWKPGASSIKSYDADTGNAVTLATTNATGTSNADAEYENIWETVLDGNTLVYDTTWYQYPGYLQVSGQKNTLVSINTDGTGKKELKSVDAGQYYFSNLKLYQPGKLYFGVYGNNGSNATYYQMDVAGNITQSNTITSNSINNNYPTYLVSPSGNQTFWSEQRDGKNTLFVGDYYGSNGKQIASLSDYSPYGWFTDSYLLVQKSGSELYIMPASGGTPLKISDYYKPPQNFNGYGGGYGGL